MKSGFELLDRNSLTIVTNKMPIKCCLRLKCRRMYRPSVLEWMRGNAYDRRVRKVRLRNSA